MEPSEWKAPLELMVRLASAVLMEGASGQRARAWHGRVAEAVRGPPEAPGRRVRGAVEARVQSAKALEREQAGRSAAVAVPDEWRRPSGAVTAAEAGGAAGVVRLVQSPSLGRQARWELGFADLLLLLARSRSSLGTPSSVWLHP